jgi:hypothetical protein
MQIGQVFLFNFYNIFDFDKGRVGFFLHKTTNSEINNDGVVREGTTTKQFPIWAIILIALVVIGIIVAFSGYLFVKHRNRKLAANLAEYNQLEGTTKGGKTLE